MSRPLAVLEINRERVPLSKADVDQLETLFLMVICEYRKGEHMDTTRYAIGVDGEVSREPDPAPASSPGLCRCPAGCQTCPTTDLIAEEN